MTSTSLKSVAKILDPSGKVRYINGVNRPLVQVLMEEDEEGNLLASYTIGNDLISMNREDDTYFYHYDGLGSVRQLTDDEGEVEEEYVYDAWGNVLASTNTTENVYGFTGEQQFGEADGLIFLRARYYDPNIGRFVSRDPILSPMVGAYGGFWFLSHLVGSPQMLHPYIYANNNPVNWVDPSGLIAIVPDLIVIRGVPWLIQCIREARRIHEETRGDAFMRHCVAACQLSRRRGHLCSYLAGLWNEIQPGPSGRSNFDQGMRDNAVGRRCAGQVDECGHRAYRSCEECCRARRGGVL